MILSNDSPGIFVSKAQIVTATNMSGQPLGFGKTFDLAIELELSVPEVDFKPKFSVYGDFKKSTDGTIVGWGGAFKVRDFIKTVMNDGTALEIDSDNPTIPDDYIANLIGKEFMRLSYHSGLKKDNISRKYSDWNVIATPDVDPGAFRLRFITSWQKTGHPKNFIPSPDMALPSETTKSPF